MPNALAAGGFDLAQALYRASERIRTRQSWNDRLAHWERPASVSEEGTIERAQLNVESALASNLWLSNQGVTIRPQGSYHNNTNVRTEADLDLRAIHPLLHIEYDPGVVQGAAREVLTYRDSNVTYGELFAAMRAEMVADFGRAFGAKNVVPGNKAIRIRGITGSRAEVDVVPCVCYHYVWWSTDLKQYLRREGVAILSANGSGWTVNYPDQHTANGVAKRARTAHRFKRIVRMLKRLRADMQARNNLTIKVPSFLVECLVYEVEDAYFLVDDDDRYDRFCRIVHRIRELLIIRPGEMLEVNGYKYLFRNGQAWSLADARTFIDTAIDHLGHV